MKHLLLSLLILNVLLDVACSTSANDNAHTTATTVLTPAPAQRLTVTPRADWIKGNSLVLVARETADARPKVKIRFPQPNQIFATSNVTIRLNLSGATRPRGVMAIADHVHVILDNSIYDEVYDLNNSFELNDVAPGRHVLRVFAARPWHESYKNAGAFQMVSFTVKGDDRSQSDAARDDQPVVDPAKPFLTCNSPQGEYKGERADPILIDFLVANAKLKADGGEYRIRYFIDDDEARYIDKWEPIWLAGWLPGKHTVRLELLGADQWPVKNGTFNITTREILVAR